MDEENQVNDYDLGPDTDEEDYEVDEPEVENINNNEVPLEFKEPDVAPKLRSRVYVNYPYLKELRDSDFCLKSRTLIDFNIKDVDINNLNVGAWFVLFHDESAASQKYLRVWLELARIVRNDRCYLAHCNLAFEKKIYKNFLALGDRNNINHPFAWAKYREAPFMMVYRDSWPQGFYNGTIYLQELIDFCAEEVANDNRELSKMFVRRRDIQEEIITRDRAILRQIAVERKKARELQEKEKEKEIDPSRQKIARAVDFTE